MLKLDLVKHLYTKIKKSKNYNLSKLNFYHLKLLLINANQIGPEINVFKNSLTANNCSQLGLFIQFFALKMIPLNPW